MTKEKLGQKEMETIERFIEKMIPVLFAGNDKQNTKFYLEIELKELYDEAFIEGQGSVLK